MVSVYPVSEIYGSSNESIEDAIRNAVGAAGKSVRNLEWFEVTDIRGAIKDDGTVGQFQVGIKLGFRLQR